MHCLIQDFYTYVILIDSKCKNTIYVFWYYFFSKTQSQLAPLSANDPFKPWVTNSEWRRTDEYHRTMLLSLIRPDHEFCTWTWWICPSRLLSGHAGVPFTNSLVLEKLSWFIRHLSDGLYIYILFKFVKSLIWHLGLAIANVWRVQWFSWTLLTWIIITNLSMSWINNYIHHFKLQQCKCLSLGIDK